jgi:hypothetical protein
MHAGVCHLYYSGDIAVRLLLDKTKERTENSDIYDALLRVFTFRNSEINNNAMDLLLSSGGLLERLFALTHNGLLELLKYTEYEAQRINNWPLDECSKLQKLFSNFTSATSDFLESLNLQQGHGNHTMLLQLIVISTLLHELVGSTIGMYFLAPHILKTKILQSEFNADTDLIESSSSYEINEIAVYFTSGATMPSLLCDSLRYCFPLQYRDRLVSYQNKLRLINKSNEDAQVDLRNLETSISL